jgi:hypothetical protein
LIPSLGIKFKWFGFDREATADKRPSVQLEVKLDGPTIERMVQGAIYEAIQHAAVTHTFQGGDKITALVERVAEKVSTDAAMLQAEELIRERFRVVIESQVGARSQGISDRLVRAAMLKRLESLSPVPIPDPKTAIPGGPPGDL